MPELSEVPPASKIRQLHEDGLPYTKLAEMYGISVETAYRLAHEREVAYPDES